MMFREGTQLYDYEVIRESGEDVMYINYLGSADVPGIASSPGCMSRTVDSIIESPNVSRIVFVQQRNYSHDFNQVALLAEIANIYTYLTKQEKILRMERLSAFACQRHLSEY